LASPQAADALKAAKGPKTGKLKVPTEITFTPTGGAPNAEDHAYKLKLK
jgi:hypothetical protein